MTVIVFCGPTVSRDVVRRELDAEVRAPAARGDLLRAAMSRPAAIGLIDGYFDRVPAVWHKEILCAMSEGIHVFGSASMGALRAAELCTFGMCGVGAVFESYRNGQLTDDDEVAIAHASHEQDYRPVSDAMVNIRATLALAERDAIITYNTRAKLETIGKALHYPDRSYALVIALAEQTELPRAELAALKAWLPTGRVDQKRDDALAMVRRMAVEGRTGWTRKQVQFTFSRTDAWERLRAEVSNDVQATGPGEVGRAHCLEVSEELLVADRAMSDYQAALARAACLELARRAGVVPEPRAVRAAAEEFRRERGLLQPEMLEAWLREQHLSDVEVADYFRSEATVRSVRATFEQSLASHLIDHLRATGEYGSIAKRARAKRQALSSRGIERPELRDTQVTENELWTWYFVQKLARDVPGDLEAYAKYRHTTVDDLRAVVVREYLFGLVSKNGES